MRDPYTRISSLWELLGHRVRMVWCAEEELSPPTNPSDLEAWCDLGKSARPIQTHVGDYGVVQSIVTEEAVTVVFDDGDERMLSIDEMLPVAK